MAQTAVQTRRPNQDRTRRNAHEARDTRFTSTTTSAPPPPPPNSSQPGALDGGMGTEALEQAMRGRLSGRFGDHYVDNQAEAEATRIGSRFSGASSVDELKARMGSALGADFSGVNVHTGAEAAAHDAATAEDSYTVGNDVYLGGNFDATIAAHEMVHTVQQGGIRAAVPVMSAPGGSVQTWNPFKWIAKKIKGAISSHRRAVDAYNNHTEDFKKMSAWKRFKWAVKNPLAWLRGGSKDSKKDTEERNEIKKWEDKQAEEMAGKWSADDLGDAADVDDEGKWSVPTPSKSEPQDKPKDGEENKAADKQEQKEEDDDDDEEFKDSNEFIGDVTGEGGLSAGNTPQEGLKLVQALKGSDEPEGFGGVYDKVSGGLGLINDTTSLIGNVMDASEANDKGDDLGAGTKAVDVGADALSIASDVAGLAGADALSGGLGVAANGIKTINSTASAIGNQVTKSRLRDRAQRYEKENADLKDKKLSDMNADDRYRRSRAKAMQQGKRAASIRRNEDITSAVSSGLKTAGGVAGMAGGPVGAAVSAGANILGAATDFVGGEITSAQKSKLRKNTVNEEMDLDAKIAKLMKEKKGPDGKPLSKSMAKHIVLKSMGFKSGSRKEAFNKIAQNRAKMMAMRANKGDSEEVGIMNDMFLSKGKDGKYSSDAVAEKLGYEEMEKENPFED